MRPASPPGSRPNGVICFEADSSDPNEMMDNVCPTMSASRVGIESRDSMHRGLASALSKDVVTPLGKGIVPTLVLKLPKKAVGGGAPITKMVLSISLSQRL